MIPVAIVSLILSGCIDQEPAGPELTSVTRTADVSFSKFFVAWSESYASSPIQMQTFTLDARQDRQYAEWNPDQNVLSFAAANRGRLYIDGDEPDQYCITPSDYATMYHDFVAGVRGADPTARVSPAGFAEPNAKCCPPDDAVCKSTMHSIGYADQFYNIYKQRYGVVPPVTEWRFHDFGVSIPLGDVSGWWSRVDKDAAWSVAHGANMVLGSWGFMGWREPASDYQEHMKQAIGRILSDKRINGAVYWSYQQWLGNPHYLVNSDGSLTPEGQTFVNPLTDIPVGVKIAGSADGRAMLRWTNTTSAWAAEAEFWVQATGSNSFVYKKTELVAGLGAVQTSLVAFNIGDSVKGRVRYYNSYGQAEWSAFSNIVSGVSVKTPLCLLQKC